MDCYRHSKSKLRLHPDAIMEKEIMKESGEREKQKKGGRERERAREDKERANLHPFLVPSFLQHNL